uniref:Uncharacterized protein n=1 Tax=Arundo donax TaxID=35708 RepID=A0A0A9DDE2_ARUDO
MTAGTYKEEYTIDTTLGVSPPIFDRFLSRAGCISSDLGERPRFVTSVIMSTLISTFLVKYDILIIAAHLLVIR